MAKTWLTAIANIHKQYFVDFVFVHRKKKGIGKLLNIMFKYINLSEKKEAWPYRHLLLGVEHKWGEIEQKQNLTKQLVL